jgi:PAS domain-containing protein
MGRTQNRPLPLILARELASNVATPFLVLDADGTLIFFNERAEQIIGSTPDQLATHMKSEMDRWGPAIKKAGIRVEN